MSQFSDLDAQLLEEAEIMEEVRRRAEIEPPDDFSLDQAFVDVTNTNSLSTDRGGGVGGKSIPAPRTIRNVIDDTSSLTPIGSCIAAKKKHPPPSTGERKRHRQDDFSDDVDSLSDTRLSYSGGGGRGSENMRQKSAKRLRKMNPHDDDDDEYDKENILTPSSTSTNSEHFPLHGTAKNHHSSKHASHKKRKRHTTGSTDDDSDDSVLLSSSSFSQASVQSSPPSSSSLSSSAPRNDAKRQRILVRESASHRSDTSDKRVDDDGVHDDREESFPSHSVLFKPIDNEMTRADIVERINDFYALWVPSGVHDDVHSTERIIQLYGKDQSYTESRKLHQKFTLQYTRLLHIFDASKLAMLDSREFGDSEKARQDKILEMQSRIERVGSAIRDAESLLIVRNRFQMRGNDLLRNEMPKDDVFGYFQSYNEESLCDGLRLDLFFMRICARDNLAKRRDDDQILEPIRINGVFTFCYRPLCSFVDFCSKSVSPKELYMTQYQWMHRRGGPEQSAKHLMSTYDVQIPFIERDRAFHSFTDGIYYLPTDTFLYFDRHDDMVQIEAAMGADIVRKTAVKFHNLPMDPDQWNSSLQQDNSWYSIQTNAVDRILNAQNFSREVKQWIYTVMGRMFYNVGDKDKW